MQLVLSLDPEVERMLAARAAANGVSLEAYAVSVLEREAARATGWELVLLCARVRGMADGLDLRRDPSLGREVDWEG